jgi:hypothetical protein
MPHDAISSPRRRPYTFSEISHRWSLTFDFDLLYGANLVGRFDGLGACECKLEAK